MKCINCGFETELDYPVCPQCQAQQQPNTAAQTILRALKDPLFLVICILMSVSCLVSLSAGSMPVIEILFAVFMWLTYDKSRKDIADAKHLRCISGTVYAHYVISYVTAVLVIVMGVILTACFAFLSSDPNFLDALASGVDDRVATLLQTLFIIPSGVILILSLFIGILLIVLNVFSIRYIHRFAQSVYQSIESGTLRLKHVTAAKVWLFVLGAFAAVSTLTTLAESGITAAIGGAAGCAVSILAGLLIHKHIPAEPSANPEQ